MKQFILALVLVVLGLASQVSGFNSWGGHEEIIKDLHETFDRTETFGFHSHIKPEMDRVGAKAGENSDDDDDKKCDPYIIDYFKNCSIWSEVTTGLKLKTCSPFKYFKELYSSDIGGNVTDVDLLWKIFAKTLYKAGLYVKTPEGVWGSSDVPFAKVFIKSKRSFFPVKGGLATTLESSKNVHNKLKASFKTAEGAAEEYTVEDKAAINLVFFFPFSKAKYGISVSLQKIVPSKNESELGAPYETKEIAKVKLTKLVRAPPHKSPPPPCPKPKPAPGPEGENVMLESDQYIEKVVSTQEQSKLREKIQALHDKTDGIDRTTAPDLPTHKSTFTQYMDNVISLFGGKKPEPEEHEGEMGMFEELKKLKKHHKKHHKKDKHRKHHDDDHHHHEEPERGPLGFVKTVGFVFGKGVGFGFS